MAYKYPICDVFHRFCKIARFFATEPKKALESSGNAKTERKLNNISRNGIFGQLIAG